MHGEILVGDETIAFDGIGQRDHSWGVRDWWSLGWVWTAGGLEDGTRFHTTRIRVPGPRGLRPRLRAASRRRARADRGVHGRGGARRPRVPARQRRSPAGRSTGDRAGGVLARSTSSTTTAPARRVARFPRALCRFDDRRRPHRASAGRSGTSPADRDRRGRLTRRSPGARRPSTSSTPSASSASSRSSSPSPGCSSGSSCPGDALLFTAGFFASGPSARSTSRSTCRSSR